MEITDFTGMKDKNEIIEEFQGEFRWLSNFMPALIELDGRSFPSIEHAYVASKSDDEEWKNMCTAPSISPANIKKLGRELVVKEGFEEIKVDIMTECLRQKFNQEPYKSKLLATGERYIQEGNRWNDTFWGFCLKTGIGENNLGKLIMKIRDELRAQ